MNHHISPQERFCQAAIDCLGSPPTVEFVGAYWDNIQKTPESFFDALIESWCIKPFRFSNQQSAAVSNEGHRKIERWKIEKGISVAFLLEIDEASFLEFLYLDFLSRPISELEARRYSGMNFVSTLDRITVIRSIISSPEYVESKTDFVSEEIVDQIVRTASAETRNTPRVAHLRNGIQMGKAAGFGSLNKRYPLLWRSQNGSNLFCAFGMVLNVEIENDKHMTQSDWVFFGPKSLLQQGNYSLRLHMRCDPGDLFHFDVAYKAGTIEVTSFKFLGAIDLNILFSLSHSVDDIEFRLVNINGRHAPMDIWEVSLAPALI